jgi:predicted Zn-dependent peptidase
MKYKKTTFKNGLRVLTAPMKNTQTVTVVVMVGAGSRFETEKEAGISHFIEHMFFKGTKRRTNGMAISEELDAVGGEHNAFTSKDMTAYYAKVDSRHINLALDITSDIYLNSLLEEKEINKEKGTILQEINMYEDLPMRSVGDIFERILYRPNSLGRDVLGYKKTVSSFHRNNLKDYIKKLYLGNNTVVCIAGNFAEKKTIALVKKYFSGMHKGKKPGFAKIIENQKRPKLEMKFKKTDQTHLVVGNRAYHENHKDRFALALLSIILGGNASSRIFTEVREKRGLAYRVSTGIESYEDCGYLATQAGVEHKNIKETVRIILEEYKKIATEMVSAKELQKAKDYIKGKSVMGLEASDEVAMFLVGQAAKNKKIMMPEEIFVKIDKVTVSDILRVAKDIFREKTLNLAVIGPHRDTKKLQEILKI